jgi:subtilisin family serine protease
MDAPGTEPWKRARARAGEILARVADRNGLDVIGRIPETGQLAVDLGPGGIEALRAELADDPRVQRVELDRPIELRHVPNDPAWSLPDSHAPGGTFAQWHLRQINAPAAWDLSKGANAEVAVIDTGVDVGHTELSNRLIATYDCDPGPACVSGGVPDTNGHGTHVAGLACADSDNGVALASAGFDCRLSAFKYGSGSTGCASAATAITIAANRGADAINMSFGGCGSMMADELLYAWNAGSVPVAAGANENNPGLDYPSYAIQSPLSNPTLDSGRGLNVTATRFDGARAEDAENTRAMTVAAPGFAACGDVQNAACVAPQQGILSTWSAAAACSCRTTINGDNRFGYLVGTSMATPQVSGVVALMRSAAPTLPAPRLTRLIKLTASNCGQYQTGGTAWGLINAYRAVAAAEGRDIDAPTSSLERKKGKKGKKGKKKGKGQVLKITSADEAAKVTCSAEFPSSGVDVVRIFASRNGKQFRLVEKTSKAKFKFKPKRKGRYRFYSVAVDKAGNEEAAPLEADEKLKVKRVARRKGAKKPKRR